jgi:hypothetical protein
MAQPRRFLLLVPVATAAAALAVGATLGSAGAERAVQAKLSDFPTFLYSPVGSGELRGNIAAVQRTRTPKADVFTSLHGLKPSTEYRAWLTRLPCSKPAGEDDAILDLVGVVSTGPGEDDFFVRRTGQLSRRLARGKTFRLFEGDRQIACLAANRVR